MWFDDGVFNLFNRVKVVFHDWIFNWRVFHCTHKLETQFRQPCLDIQDSSKGQFLPSHFIQVIGHLNHCVMCCRQWTTIRVSLWCEL